MTDQIAGTTAQSDTQTDRALSELTEEDFTTLQSISSYDKDLTAGNEKALLQSVSAEENPTYRISLDDIHIIPGLNPRIDTPRLQAHIRWLADSIKQSGFMESEPISCHVEVVDGKDVLVINDGHCRYKGAVLAKSEGAEIDKLPVVIKRNVTIEDITFDFINTQRGLSLTPIELAGTCKRLRNFQLSEKVIAQRLCVTETYVINLLTLANAPRAIRNMVVEGTASAALAMDTIAKHGPSAAVVMTEALEKARKVGKTKVTAKFMPTQIQKKALVAAAPVMYKALDYIAKHPKFESMDEELRQMVNDVLKNLPQASGEVRTDENASEDSAVSA